MGTSALLGYTIRSGADGFSDFAASTCADTSPPALVANRRRRRSADRRRPRRSRALRSLNISRYVITLPPCTDRPAVNRLYRHRTILLLFLFIFIILY